MKETRQIVIKKKIFTKSDILNIGQILLNEYNSAQKKEHHSSVAFKLNCSDGTSYESESYELFENGSIIDIKKINSLEMSFSNYKLESYINFSITHGNEYGNHLIVRGNDRNWVDGLFTRLKEIINSVKPQNHWILKYKTLILHLIALGVGVIIYSILNFLLYRHIQPIKNPSDTVQAIRTFFITNPFFVYLIDWFLRWFMGIPWAISIRSWLLNLWPVIEFDFGPEHMKVEKNRRFRIALIFSSVVIPIFLSILYDIFK